MKRLAVIIVIASFIAVGVFGFAAMNSGHGKDGQLCLANVAKSFGCLEETNTFSLNTWHANIFKNFSTATLLLVGLAFWIVLASSLAGAIGFSPQADEQYVRIEHRAFRPQIQSRLAAWIQNLEKRDPAN